MCPVCHIVFPNGDQLSEHRKKNQACKKKKNNAKWLAGKEARRKRWEEHHPELAEKKNSEHASGPDEE